MNSRSGRIVFQFRLRTVLVLVTAGIIALGLVTRELNRERLRKQNAEQIRRLDGWVRYSLRPKNEHTGVVNGYLRVFLGDEYFPEVASIYLKPRTEADLNLLRSFPETKILNLVGAQVKLERLRGLPQLGQLSLVDANISERDMKALTKLNYLSSLRFTNCSLADQSLNLLSELPNLRGLEFDNCVMPGEFLNSLTRASNLTLSFKNCALSDSDLRSMHGARSSVKLNLFKTSVTEAGILALWEANPAWSVQYSAGERDYNILPSMKELPQTEKLTFRGSLTSDATLATLVLRPLRNLKSLSIIGAPITDESLGALAGLTKLQILSLTGTKIEGPGLRSLSSVRKLVSDVADQGVAEIAKLTELEELWLVNPRVSDEGIEDLAKMNSLRRLYLLNTSVSDSGVSQLQQALPNCNIATE